MITWLGIQITVWLTIVSLCLIWLKTPRVWQTFYVLTLTVGLVTGALEPTALLFVALVAGLLLLYQTNSRGSSFAFIGLLIIGVLLGLHVLPGFNNQEYLGAYQLNNHVAPFSIWFNYDKSMFGLLALGVLFHSRLIRTWPDLSDFLVKLVPVLVLGIPAVYAFGLLLGYAQFDWTLDHTYWPWALKNVFFTVVAEELLFRGLIQREISLRLRGRYADSIAIVVAAFLFGAAHFAGGFQYVFLSALAGCVYGYAYKVTGRIEGAIVAHFLLNAVHFLLFSYPYAL